VILGYRYDFNPKIIKTDSDTSEPVAGTEPAQDVLAANAETPLDRKKRRAELQRLYGLNPHAEAKKLEKSKSPLFIGGAKWHDSVPEGHSGIDNYRYFVIDVELFEFGFSGSHNLTVYTHSGERIGTVSVFSRLDDASCPSCQGRRAEANVVRGVIPVPPTIVAEILEKGGWDTDEEKTAIQNFKGSLRAEVTKAGGAVLAHINAANPPATLVPLPETSVPKLSLRSAYAAHPTDWKDGPIRLYGWERHEKVFDEGKWHKEA
jgi:tyrosinase